MHTSAAEGMSESCDKSVLPFKAASTRSSGIKTSEAPAACFRRAGKSVEPWCSSRSSTTTRTGATFCPPAITLPACRYITDNQYYTVAPLSLRDAGLRMQQHSYMCVATSRSRHARCSNMQQFRRKNSPRNTAAEFTSCITVPEAVDSTGQPRLGRGTSSLLGTDVPLTTETSKSVFPRAAHMHNFSASASLAVVCKVCAMAAVVSTCVSPGLGTEGNNVIWRFSSPEEARYVTR